MSQYDRSIIALISVREGSAPAMFYILLVIIIMVKVCNIIIEYYNINDTTVLLIK